MSTETARAYRRDVLGRRGPRRADAARRWRSAAWALAWAITSVGPIEERVRADAPAEPGSEPCVVQFDPAGAAPGAPSAAWSRTLDQAWLHLAFEARAMGGVLCAARERINSCPSLGPVEALDVASETIRRRTRDEIRHELGAAGTSPARRRALATAEAALESENDPVLDVDDDVRVRLAGGAPILFERVGFGPHRTAVQTFGFVSGQSDPRLARVRERTRLYVDPPGDRRDEGRDPKAPRPDAVVEFETDRPEVRLVVARRDPALALCEDWRRVRARMDRGPAMAAGIADTVVVPRFHVDAVGTQRLRIETASRGSAALGGTLVAHLALAIEREFVVARPWWLHDLVPGVGGITAVFDKPFLVALVDAPARRPRWLASVNDTGSLVPTTERPMTPSELHPFEGRWVADPERTAARAVREELERHSPSALHDPVKGPSIRASADSAGRSARHAFADIEIAIHIDGSSEARIEVRRRAAGTGQTASVTHETLRVTWSTDSVRLRRNRESGVPSGDARNPTPGGMLLLESDGLVVTPCVGPVDRDVVFRLDDRSEAGPR